MKIRTAKSNDVEALVPLFIEYNKSLWKLLPKKESFFKKPKRNLDNAIKKSLNQMISNKNHKILVIQFNGQIIGSISGWINNHKKPYLKILVKLEL